MTVDELINKIKGADKDERGKAWQEAASVGSGAIPPLAKLAAEKDMEVARAATRAIGKIIHHVGRPGAGGEKDAALKELLAALAGALPAAVQREILWMVSELPGADSAVGPVAALLANGELRDDARMVLERMPGEKSLAALKTALAGAPAEFKPAVAHSLRVRGVEVPSVPEVKLVPTKPTTVKPAGR